MSLTSQCHFLKGFYCFSFSFYAIFCPPFVPLRRFLVKTYIDNQWITFYNTFCIELSVGIISIYGVGSHASYPNAHKLLLHTDTVLKAYTLIERLERDVLDERYSVYLYVVDFCTELNGLCFLTSYDGTYIMTVNAHNTVIDLPAFKHFLFLYKTFPTMESRF